MVDRDRSVGGRAMMSPFNQHEGERTLISNENLDLNEENGQTWEGKTILALTRSNMENTGWGSYKF